MPNERYSLKATLLAPCHPPDGIQRRWAHTANPLGQNFVSIIASSKMHRYKLGKSLGEGAFGSVRQAALEDTKEQVAIKTLKDKCKDFDSMMKLPEVKALRNIAHENVIKCKEICLDEKGRVHLVFELLPGGNLESLARTRREPFSEDDIRSVFYQLLQAVRHMHSLEYMHRDIKPENILLESPTLTDGIRIKLADLGLAKRCKPNQRPHTTYVATRWYRSPEILLRISDYSYASDLWAVGAVMAELVSLGNPLFPGDDEQDQLAKVFALRGHPSLVGWARGEQAMKKRRIKLPKTTPASLQSVVPLASLPVLQLVSDLLELDPECRPSASQALQYPLFVAHHAEDCGTRGVIEQQRQASGLDTAMTRDYPSSRWSAGSDIDLNQDLEQNGPRLHNYYDKYRTSPYYGTGEQNEFYVYNGARAVSRAPQEPTQESGQLFNIPKNVNAGSSPAKTPYTRTHRCPAGKFAIRH